MSGVLQTLNNLNYSKEKLDDGKIKLNIEIEQERFQIAKDKVFKRLAPSVKVEGFRPGKAPQNVIEAKLGPQLFEETLGELVPQCTLEVIKKEKLNPLDQIAYQIEKVADGSGVKYSATFTVFPEFKLPNLKKIKVERKKTSVTKEDIDRVIKQMHDDSKKGEKGKDKKSGKPDDAWASSLAGIKDLADLKSKVKKELKRQKEAMEDNRYFGEVIKAIVEKSKFDAPKSLLDQEIVRREEAYKARIKNLGMKLEDFLRNQKTTMEKLKKDWEKEAAEALKAEIVLMQVAKEYKINVTDSDIDKQIGGLQDEKLKEHYKTPEARRYLYSLLLRQKVLEKIRQEVGK